MPRLVRFLALVPLAALLGGCAGLTAQWKAPEVALTGLRIRELSLTSQDFLVTLAVKNPNDRTLPIKALTYRVQIEGNDLAQGSSRLDRQIPALATAEVQVGVRGSLLGIVQSLPALATQEGPLDWSVSGTVTIADGLIALPYRRSGQIDAAALLARP